MIINGIIEEIIFRNEDNGYTVAVISCENDGADEYITITGKLPEVNVGQSLKLEGKYVRTKYGEQFAFESAEVMYPSSLSGIKKYLSSGLIKGIGPVTASIIVDAFGKDTLDIIEFNPSKLATVRGISKKKAGQISLAFNEIKKMQNTVMFLQGYNITTNLYGLFLTKSIVLSP